MSLAEKGKLSLKDQLRKLDTPNVSVDSTLYGQTPTNVLENVVQSSACYFTSNTAVSSSRYVLTQQHSAIDAGLRVS